MISNFTTMLKHSTQTNGFNSFSFKTPEQYYEFRKAWKENYKEMTMKIRELKNKRKDSNSAIASRAQSEKAKMRILARSEMERLEDAKAEYKRIREERKEEREVA